MAGSKPLVRQGALAASLAVWLVVSLFDQLPALASARRLQGTGFDALQPSAGRWLLAELNPSSPSDEEQLEELIRREGPLRAKGAYAEAALLWEKIVAIVERTLGPDHPGTAKCLNNLASLYFEQGLYEKAKPLLKRSLDINEKVEGREHPSTITSLNNLAVIYRKQGRLGEAEAFQNRAVAISIRVLGSNHSTTAINIFNLAELNYLQGRFAESEVYYLRSLSIAEKALEPNHPLFASIFNNLAALYEDLRRPGEAEALYVRSLTIRKKALGLQHPEVATSLNNLALLYTNQGRYNEAEVLYMRAQAIQEFVLGHEHPNVAISYNNLALLFGAEGRYEEADTLHKRSLTIREKMLGLEHPDTIASINNLSWLYLLQGKSSAAELQLKRLNSIHFKWLTRELPLQARDLRFSLMQRQPAVAAMIFDLLDQSPSTAPLALETRLNRQGLLTEIELRQALLKASSPETRRLAAQVADINIQLSSIIVPLAQREPLRQQRQQLEAQLYRLLPALKIDPVSNAQVAAALKAADPQGLLVEFQKYKRYRKDAKGKPNGITERYVALLLKPDGTIRAIPLGEAKAIDEAVKVALTATVKNEQRQTQALAVLSQRVFGPLQPHLSGVNVLFLSPDGELNRVPFAALPSPADPGRYLSEAFQLRILTTGRDLVRLQQPIQAAGGQTAGSNVLMADPDYGPITGTSSTPTLPSWLPLPYTRAEAEQLKGLLNAPQPFLGKEATAARVLRSRGPRMLHIATHGYFQPEAVNTEGPRLKASRGADGTGFAAAQLNQPNSQLQLESQEPLQRIFLALAGANIPNTNAADDGRLTAAEATGMDLAGTELVTLSACDTARGEIRSGEGVYGLQRALTVAGARSTLLSLWRVGDQRTAVFMAEFYKRLKAGQPRADALRDTQAFFRKHPDPTYRDVYAWGGFQLTGDWRPVEGL
jgi:CHAT domain-containing protein